MRILLFVCLYFRYSYAVLFGRHQPYGQSGIDYLYGQQGTYRQLKNIIYEYNYYEQYATEEHPYDKNALISMSNGTTLTTCRDANGHLLLDFNHDYELDVTSAGGAFHEHNGYGAQCNKRGEPFTNFWLDDNYLARYASAAYHEPLPDGLTDYTDFTRWRILGGYDPYWYPYEQDYIDTLALDGVYYLSIGSSDDSEKCWNRIAQKSDFYYDSALQQYVYPGITENYHMALFRILTDALLMSTTLSISHNTLLQHSVALRSNILSLQQRCDTYRAGWLSSITDNNSLMNTESIALGVLSLASSTRAVYEVGVAPLSTRDGFFYRPYYALSAVNGESPCGNMLMNNELEIGLEGQVSVILITRSPYAGSDPVAQFTVKDVSGVLLGTSEIFGSSNMWCENIVVLAALPSIVSVNIEWFGAYNIDIAFVSFL